MKEKLINADKLSEELSALTVFITGLRAGKGVLGECLTEYRKGILRIVDEQPAIEAVPVVHSRWGYAKGKLCCQNCFFKPDYSLYDRNGFSNANYCPNCGADMR